MPLTFRPLSRFVGAEIIGLDLHQPITASEADALRDAFRTYHLLLQRQDGLTLDEQIAFSTVFGELHETRAYKGELGSKGYFISNTRPDGQIPTGELEYHHDHLFFDRPIKAGVLYGLEIPASGSVTKFRNAIELAARLPEPLRERAHGVKCLHVMDYQNVTLTGRPDASKISPKAARAWQPLLWQQRDDEPAALWAVPVSTIGFKGIDPNSGEGLLAELVDFGASMTALEYPHTWRPGDLMIWDNYRLAHARMPFESAEPRTLRRTSVRA